MQAPPAPGPPPAWSVAVRLKSGNSLDLRVDASNILPGWGRGGERISLLLRLRRLLRLSVASHCHHYHQPPPTKPKNPGASKLRRFLGLKWVSSIWRRRKAPEVGSWRWIRIQPNWLRTQNVHSVRRDRRWMTMVVHVALVVLASIAVLRFMMGYWRVHRGLVIPRCTSWICFLAKHTVKFLAPPLYEWLPKFTLLK